MGFLDRDGESIEAMPIALIDSTPRHSSSPSINISQPLQYSLAQHVRHQAGRCVIGRQRRQAESCFDLMLPRPYIIDFHLGSSTVSRRVIASDVYEQIFGAATIVRRVGFHQVPIPINLD